MPKEIFHPGYAFLDHSELLTFDEIERLSRMAVALGVRKIRITGGEPLLRPDLPVLIRRLRAIDGLQDLAMTTNGSLLNKRAAELADAGLDRITVSLDSLRDTVFSTESGTKPGTLQRVLEGIEAAQTAGLTPVKVNCVVRRNHNCAPEALVELARRFRDTPTVLRFIEYMDVGTTNDWSQSAVVSASDILDAVHADARLVALPAKQTGDVARRFGYVDHPGEIGVINSVSKPFCADCNRMRLSADGRLLTCLFAADGVDVRSPLRSQQSDEAVSELLKTTWQQRSDRYSELRAKSQSQTQPRRRLEMYQVGG